MNIVVIKNMYNNIILFVLIILILAGCLHQEQGTLVTRDYVPANQIHVPNLLELQGLADNGNPVAQYQLGYLYYSGLGVSKSHKRAMEWWLKSANAGNVDSQYALGILYFEGVGIKTDFVEGCRWLGAAASSGIPAAINMYNYKCRN